MTLQFTKATKAQAKLRLALIGPSGSGKTYSALKIAEVLGDRVAVVDTERGSASKYADLFTFDTLELDSFNPETYVEAIKSASDAGYDVLVIDSLSHAWMGKEGALEQVDKAATRSLSKNNFTAWREVTPMHNHMVDAIIQAPLHIIATMRAKTEYIMEPDSKGKMVPRKIGLAPIQRDGLEYEFDVVADMDLDNNLIVSKTRCPEVAGAVIKKPGKDFALTLKGWLSDGTAPKPKVNPDDLPAPESALDKFYSKAMEAESIGVVLPGFDLDGVTTGTLREYYKTVQDAIKAKKAQPTLATPPSETPGAPAESSREQELLKQMGF